jgi:hypothetical protein
MRVRITIEYDTDDETATPETELEHWRTGGVDIQDFLNPYTDPAEHGFTITAEEVGA